LLAFFRINDPFRIIGIFLLIILIRLPFFFGEMPLIVPELEWMLVGSSISFQKILYLDVWDDLAPLSAMVYALVDFAGGRSQWAYQLIAIVVVFFQSYLFNKLLISSKAFKENTYVPALTFTTLMSTFFDFFTLSPVLMSGIFQLFLINGIFNHLAVKAKDEQFLNIGLALGLSTLFYLPSLAYLPVSILSLGLFSSMTFKRYILMFFGFLFPIVLVGVFFFWHGGLLQFIDSYFFSWMATPFRELVSLKTMWFISISGLVLLVFSWIKIYTGSRYNNLQNNYMLIMILFLIGAFVMVFMSRERAPHQLMVFVAPMSFYIAHLFLLIKRKVLTEAIFLAFFAITLTINYGVLYKFVVPQALVQYEDLLVQPTPWDQIVQGKKLLIMGDEPDAYLHAYPATPYLNWNLSKAHLNHINSFNTMSLIYDNFINDMPEVILDQKQVVPQLFMQMPTISSKYTKQGNAYLLKSSVMSKVK